MIRDHEQGQEPRHAAGAFPFDETSEFVLCPSCGQLMIPAEGQLGLDCASCPRDEQ